jgi:translation initiation factor eIF-2B subunit delta
MLNISNTCPFLAGDPDVISKVHGREDINFLDGSDNSAILLLLNLM